MALSLFSHAAEKAQSHRKHKHYLYCNSRGSRASTRQTNQSSHRAVRATTLDPRCVPPRSAPAGHATGQAQAKRSLASAATASGWGGVSAVTLGLSSFLFLVFGAGCGVRVSGCGVWGEGVRGGEMGVKGFGRKGEKG